MKTFLFAIGAAGLVLANSAAAETDADALWSAFSRPCAAAKPWTYWLWENTHIDSATIADDLDAIRDLGFGAVLMSDSRGYWDDEDHVVKPPASVVWGSDRWLDLVAEAIRAAAGRGLGFTLNVAASGGKLCGETPVGADAPKVLICRRYRPGARFERPDFPHFGEVAAFAVRTAEPLADSPWRNAGDGFFTMSATSGVRADGEDDLTRVRALEVRALATPADAAGLGADWTVVRFAWRTIPGHEADIDVLDPAAVRRHLVRVVDALRGRCPELCGRDKTFTHLYNVSWEGAMPTWSPTFEADFARFAKRALRPLLPVLAGFDLDGVATDEVMRDFRRARGEMMRVNFYETLRDFAHERDMDVYSESGGPWVRSPQVFGEADQLAYLAVNDVPQGEFWPVEANAATADSNCANRNGRYFVKGPVYAAHVYGKPIVSAEAFTHMSYHWSVDPAFLKPIGDQAFADGVNRFVWHTFTSSMKSFGTPGLEFFAGSHINRNVTWHRELPAFVRYLARCQALLQAGEPVTDIAVLAGDRSYAGWGRFRDTVSDELNVRLPFGYAADLVNDDAFARQPKLLGRYRIVFDARGGGNAYATVPVGDLKPDVFAQTFTWCHRRSAEADWYFVVGEGREDVVFRCAAETVEVWDPVTGRRYDAGAERLADGRTKVTLALPRAGSCFVVFTQKAGDKLPPFVGSGERVLTVGGPWDVSFAYPTGIAAAPPAAREMTNLVGWVAIDDLRHFAGTASYKAAFDFKERPSGRFRLSVGHYATGVAHVYLNGRDCGTVWCEPWEADVTAAVRQGRNELEIRYTNNWYNRLVGDAALPESERVTQSVLRLTARPRATSVPGNWWLQKPTVWSGYSACDPLQQCGLMGPVVLLKERDRK